MAKASADTMLLARLTDLKAAYRKRLLFDLEQINQLVKACTQPPHTPDMQALHAALHKLAGSAGTFGFAELGQQARRLEQVVSNAIEASTPPDKPLEVSGWTKQLQNALKADERRNATRGVESSELKKDHSKHRVWLVERDTILADYIRQQLNTFGFQVEYFIDSEELLACAKAPPDLLLVDHRAGRRSEILKDPERYWHDRLINLNCPIVFTGAEEGFKARLQAVRNGGSGYFAKPLDVPQLAAYVASLLQETRLEPERVLIVEDDDELAQYCQTALVQAGMVVKCLSHPKDLIQTASDFGPELVLMDLWLPEATGAEMAMMLSQTDRWAQLPIVYLSAEQNAELRSHALSMGGDAFLDKPIDPALLVKVCRSRVRRLRNLQQAMNRDGLTGLVKHASFKEALLKEWAYTQRHPRAYSVVMLDIDHFKSVNDTHGHAVGDLVIAAVGTLLRQHFRTTDTLARYGGEEFALILPDCTSSKAAELVNGLRTAFQAIQFLDGDTSFSCTLSAGVADNLRFPDEPAEGLLEQADQALYQAKNDGRNRVCLSASESVMK